METLFHKNGIHAIVDGQYGSTGKGTFAYWLAKQAHDAKIYVEGTIYSGGPNSGHTFYHEGEKHVNKQLPTFPVAMNLISGRRQVAYLSAGAIIDILTLFEEAERYPNVHVFVHPNAAIVHVGDKEAESQGTIAATASTRSGTGAALMRKISRDPLAIWRRWVEELEGHLDMPSNVHTLEHNLHPESKPYIMEVAQGFSLGINQPFYPKVTSRECTVAQGMADACLSPRHVKRVYMCVRTYPIRVGNVDGFSSGDWYSDQEEIDWERLGVEPELTTVTRRVRRIATFSQNQFEDACFANTPDFVFVNFLNYIPEATYQKEFVDAIKENRPFGVPPFGVIEGYGPRIEDIKAPVDLLAC